MSQEVRGNDAPFVLDAVERAIIRVPRSSHHGLTKTPTAVRIAGRTYLDLARLEGIDASQLPEVMLAARLYHLAHTHRAMVVTGQCALWAHGYGSTLSSLTSSLTMRTVGTRIRVRPSHTCAHYCFLNVNPFGPTTRSLSRHASFRADNDHTESRSSITANRRRTWPPHRKPRSSADHRRTDLTEPESCLHPALHDR